MLKVRERLVTTRTQAILGGIGVALIIAVLGILGFGVARYFKLLPPTKTVRYHYVPADAASAVFTYKGDNTRQGVYSHEMALSPASLASGSLHKAESYPVDGQVYAQPLYIPGVRIAGGTYNVVIVATEHDSVYAFDADQTTPAPPFWKLSLLTPGATAVKFTDVFPPDAIAIQPEVGITGTPVIDPATHTLYVADMEKQPGKGFVHRLFAIELSTGHSRSVIVSASVPGVGDGNVDGVVSFAASQELQREALLLWHHRVYVSYTSFGDRPPYHGWIFGYDAATLHQVAALNVTPDGSDGGIWSSGDGPAIGVSHSLMYIEVGNGTFDLASGGRDAGDAILALDPDLTIRDYFAPHNQAYMSQIDLDVGSAGAVAATIPGSGGDIGVVIASGKSGQIWLLTQDKLGGYDPHGDHPLSSTPDSSVRGGVFTTPTYWRAPGSTTGYLYITGLADYFKAYQISDGKISAQPVTQSTDMLSYPGGTPVVSWNGSAADSALVWLLTPSSDSRTSPNLIAPGYLRAYKATDLSHPIYQSPAYPYVKFTAPTIAAGQVFIGTADSLDIYRLTAG